MNKGKLLMTGMIISAILLGNIVKAQEVKGKSFVNAGIGIGTFGFSGTGGLPITGSYEYGFSDKISAGVYLGFIKRNFADGIKYSYVVAGARGSYHFNELLNVNNPKVDLYGGAALYYRSFKVKYKGDESPAIKSSGGDLGIGIFAAGRYMFSDHVGAFAELGYGISPLQLGVTFKF